MLLAKALRKRGWRVSVVALSGSGRNAATELAEAGVKFFSLEMRKGLADPRGWLRFNRWLRRERPEVVHAHLPHAAWLSRWSRLIAPVPVLIDTLHSSSTGGWGRRFGYRISRRLPDCVTAVSNGVAEAHVNARMARAEALAIISNGIDAEQWRPDAQARAEVRRELGLTDEFLWLAAGRLEPVKDYPAMLKAMRAAPEPARLLIAGSGPMEQELRTLAARLGLNGRVRFLGFRNDLVRWMQAADAFVLSSRWEGLPMGLLEAAACALPAVATDVPGSREALAEGETGWLAPANDMAALARAMARMAQMPAAERRAMGERARRRAAEKFGLDTVASQWEKLYTELLRRGSGD
jgi:glycosyltransferase involved in cell wall biosynthesis